MFKWNVYKLDRAPKNKQVFIFQFDFFASIIAIHNYYLFFIISHGGYTFL